MCGKCAAVGVTDADCQVGFMCFQRDTSDATIDGNDYPYDHCVNFDAMTDALTGFAGPGL